MTALVLPLTSTGRKYGYIIWSKTREEDVRHLLDADIVTLVLPNGAERHRRIDWKNRRISLGYFFTRALPESVDEFVLEPESQGRIRVTCR